MSFTSDLVRSSGYKTKPTRIQWAIEEDEKKGLYDDLGIIGEISSPESRPKKNFSSGKCGYRDTIYNVIENCKSLKFETPSSSNCSDDIKRKRALTRLKRKRIRHTAVFGINASSAKLVRMDANNNSMNKSEDGLYKDACWINSIPDEIFLKIFNYVDSQTRVLCSRVCWRWNRIVNDKSLWQQVSLSKKTIEVHQLQRFLKRGVQVLCLNCTAVTQDMSQDYFNSSFDDSTMYTSSPCRDPFSRAYHYTIHSLDFTNANASSNVLCLILMRCSKLRNLSLEGLTISHNVLGCLSNCEQLERLNLCLCHDVTMSGMVQLLRACRRVLELNIAWTNLCQSDPTEMFESLPTGLKSLNISGFRDALRDHHVAAIASRCCSLTEIDASDSNLLTSAAVDILVQQVPETLKAVNMSRCYSINPNAYLRFSRLYKLRYLDVFGVMDDVSIGTLAAALPRVRVCLRPFSAIARPSPSALYGTRRRTVWGYYVV